MTTVPFRAPRLQPPRSPDRLVDRERLFERLDCGAGLPLTTVTGRAGSGKTLLVVSWLRADRAPWPVAWVTLEPGGSGARFWADVLAALQATVPGAPELAQLAPPIDRVSGPEFVSSLVAALSQLEAPVILVLDDAHELRDPDAAQQLAYLIERASERLRIVLASRRDPDLPLHRLRLTDELAEIRADELTFSVAEAAQLFARLGLELTGDQVRALCDRTEGWAAGLRIAALSLARSADVDAFVRALSGDERPMAEYLVAEVLARQPPRTRDFLLRTSVAARLTPALADALTGDDDGARRLAELEQDNAFVVCTHTTEVWYRYHQLFADVLRMELARALPIEVARLHGRAAEWHAERGLWHEALEHAGQADDPALLGRLLTAGWLDLYLDGDAASVREAVTRLPISLVAEDPLLAVSVAAMHLMDADALAAEPCLRLAEAGGDLVAEEDRRQYEVSLAVAQLVHDRLVGDLQGTIARARRVLEPGGGLPWQRDLATDDKRALAALNIGAVEVLTNGRLASALNLHIAVDLARRRGRDFLLVLALGHLADLDVISGDLRACDARAREAIDLAQRRGWVRSPAAAPALLADAACRYHWDELDEALAGLERARRALHSTSEPALRLSLHYLEGQVLAALGRRGEALLRFREAAAMRLRHQDPHFLTDATTWAAANVLIDDDRDDEAAALLDQARCEPRPTEHLVPLARLLRRAGDDDGALALVQPCLTGAASHGHVEQLLDAWLTAAEIHAALGDHGAAGRHVEQALALAEPQGLVRAIVNHGDRVRPLLEHRVRAGTAHRSLVADILERLDGHHRSQTEAAPPAEPLSDRELDVLRYLPTLMSSAEIAAELFVSVNTVRTHVKNIYRKLGVGRRAHAVQRARALGLIGPGSGLVRGRR